MALNRRRRKNPFKCAEEWIDKDEDPPGFMIKKFEEKGRGIVTMVDREKGEFLLIYKGEVIGADEGEQREDMDGGSGYRFFYKCMGKHLCVDATTESSYLGRLVNHGRKADMNAKMKEIKGQLALFSIREIKAGEEILYDYGLKNLPWELKSTQAQLQNVQT